MSTGDVRSVIIDIGRQRVFAQKSADVSKKKITKTRASVKSIRKPSDVSLRKYSLPDSKPLQVNALKHDDLLLPYRLYGKKQKSNKKKQSLDINLHEKYKIISTDLRDRLHVEDPPDDVRAVTDIDNVYFQYLNSNPLTQYVPLYKSLKFQYYHQLRMRQEDGYRADCVLNIEQNHRKELLAYEHGTQRYKEQVGQFNVFLCEDYKKSMECLRNSEIKVTKIHAKISELEHLANEQFLIQSRLLGLHFMYYKQQEYGRFLYYLSPPSWRARHREFARSVEIEAKGFDLGTSSEEDTFKIIFENMQNECGSGLVKPVLYFSNHKPSGLMSIFENIEKQQLHHFTHVSYLAPHKKLLNEVIKTLKLSIEEDSTWVAQFIKDFETDLDFCEKREAQLKAKFMKILYGLFYDTVAAADVLKLQMHLEYCFEKLYGEKSSHISIASTAKALEQMYMVYSFELEDVSNHKMQMALKQSIADEKIKMKRAHKAARELRLFSRLQRPLLRANEQVKVSDVSCVFHSSIVRRPSHKPVRQLSKGVVKTSMQCEITDAELEYLALFTDWTEKENPADYLQSLTISDRRDSVHH